LRLFGTVRLLYGALANRSDRSTPKRAGDGFKVGGLVAEGPGLKSQRKEPAFAEPSPR